MEVKRSEISKIIKQDRKKDTPKERYIRIQINKSLKDRKRDKDILIFLNVVGFVLAVFGPSTFARVTGLVCMFLSALLSILA